MRNYNRIDCYLNELAGDVYQQPPDKGHNEAIEHLAIHWLSKISNFDSVVDVGCGQGVALHTLARYAKRVEGVTLGEDADIAQKLGYVVNRSDMSFLPYNDSEFDMIFARHSIEHSPMPLLTLMEWYRVSKQWLMIVVPDLDHYKAQGRNHYSVLSVDHWKHLLDRAGWNVIWLEYYEPVFENRFFCEKKERILQCTER